MNSSYFVYAYSYAPGDDFDVSSADSNGEL